MSKQKTDACPECGCREFVNKDLIGEGYRCCKNCEQDWWVDIDYKKQPTADNELLRDIDEYVHNAEKHLIASFDKSLRILKQCRTHLANSVTLEEVLELIRSERDDLGFILAEKLEQTLITKFTNG